MSSSTSALKRSLPRFLSFRLPKKRLLKSISAPLMEPLNLPIVRRTTISYDSPDEGVGDEEMRDCEDDRAGCCGMDEEEGAGSSTPVPISPSTSSAVSMEDFVIRELISTERTYVSELESIVEFYVTPFECGEVQAQLHPALRGRSELVFGNLRDIVALHSRFVLPDVLAAGASPSLISRALLAHRHRFFGLYLTYCQHKQSNEAMRKQVTECTGFLSECQRRAGHPLPLSAYLLKPVQRITKYQLLLRELERHCRPEARDEVTEALRAMLELLAQINAAIHQLHISGFNGDLRLLGPLRLQSEADVFTFSRKKSARRPVRAQRRHVFLFDGGVLFCKKRQTMPAVEQQEYYEHKLCIPAAYLGFSSQCRSFPGLSRFELWDTSKTDGYSVEPVDAKERLRWVDRLGDDRQREPGLVEGRKARPKSCTSVLSTESSSSGASGCMDMPPVAMDRNGNAAERSPTASSSGSSTECRMSPEEVAARLPVSLSAEQLINT